MSVSTISDEPTNAEKIRGLRWVIAGTMLGNLFGPIAFGSVFLLFLDELGMPKDRIGAILSIFSFCGLLALFIAPFCARLGFKRTFITFWGIRNLVFCSLVFAPVILSRFGANAAFIYVAAVISAFAICRAVAETASFPWVQEYIPSSIRGKFTAITRLTGRAPALLSVAIASAVIAHFDELNKVLTGFVILIAGASVFGLLSALAHVRIPGGKPVRTPRRGTAHLAEMMGALRDRNYTAFLAAQGLTIAAMAFMVFGPLFLKEQVGLSTANVISLPIAAMVGSTLFIYLWGWAADRYGAKPVLLSSLSIFVFMPLSWLLIPRASPWSYPCALGVSFLFGAAATGADIGRLNLLYNVIVPPQKKTGYLAVYYAWLGVIGGLATLLAGRLLRAFEWLQGEQSILSINQYTPVFILSAMLVAGGVVLYRRIHVENTITTRQFASMFLHGNPLSAFGAMIGFNLARREPARVSAAERLGRTRSPLNIDQLRQMLSDPSFNVRYEAVISIARTRPDHKLVDALIALVRSREPDLSIAAVWALGRVKAAEAIPPLREALDSGYPLLQARSARELANLGDTEITPELLQRFRNEQDTALRVAYASALGVLACREAVGDLLEFLRATPAEALRNETTLALARIVGAEEHFMSLWRRSRSEMGTTASQAVSAIQKQLRKLLQAGAELQRLIASCADAFARDQLSAGAGLLAEIIDTVPVQNPAPAAVILAHCRQEFARPDAPRGELLLLALHSLREGLNQMQKDRLRRKKNGL